MENCWWMQGRLFQLWQCIRDQTEQIEKFAPYTFYFYFCIFNFLLFFFCYYFFVVVIFCHVLC